MGPADVGRALRHWDRRDPVLAAAARRTPIKWEPRPSWSGFESLVISLVHQQVSIAAGRSIAGRVRSACGGRITPGAIQELSPEGLRACGVSRQKQSYIRDLAARNVAGEIDFREVARLTDSEAIDALTRVKGIGVWTAKMFLLFHERRPDVVAPEDLGLRIAAGRLYGVRPSRAAAFLTARSPVWSPYGSLASLVLWATKDRKE